MVTIENEFLTVKICRKGAELRELTHRGYQINYLWDADPNYWPKYSPVLFPIVGTLIHNTYHFAGKSYQLPRHGFARDKAFELVFHSNHQAYFELVWDQSTLDIFPFRFRLQLQYTLQGNTCEVRYVVSHEDPTPMWFSLGAHPAFKVPLFQDEAYTDYHLEFLPGLKPEIHPLNDGLLLRETMPVALEQNTLSLSPERFAKDALVFRSVKLSHIILNSKRHHHGIKLGVEGWPDLGLWAAPEAPFVCIEPWCGHADFTDHDGSLSHKSGIISLEPGAIWQKAWSVTCF